MAISAVLTVYNAPYGIDQTMSRMWLRGKLAWGAGTYAAGGVLPNVPPYSDASGAAVLIPTLNVQPDDIVFTSVAGSGYVYQWNAASGKIQIFVGGGGVSAGTIVSTSTAPTITTTSGGVATVLGVAAGALSEVAGATGITGVQAPTITSTFTGSAAGGAALMELANGALPAGVLADVIKFEAIWVKD